MGKKTKPYADNVRSQANKYDKIWRENMQLALPGIIEKILKIQVLKSEDLPHKLQITQEKEADSLKKITDHRGETFILHIEAQVKDDRFMAYRMLEYRVMIERIHKLPVRQYVIYLGEREPKMPRKISSAGLEYEYTLIRLSKLSYRLFLSSDKPEEKLLAVLADFEDSDPEEVIRSIVEQVAATSDGDLTVHRHLQQLRIIIQLRTLAIPYQKAMETVAKFFKEENDPFYQKGVEKGLEKGIEQGIEKGVEKGRLEGMTEKEYEKNFTFTQTLIRETDFDDAKIAGLVNVSVEFVTRVRSIN